MEETAVIVNEFGEIGLDHLLVEQATEATVLLNSGCLCCTVRGDLVAGMRDLYKRRVTGEVPAFQRLVIATTGLAAPKSEERRVGKEGVSPFRARWSP